MGSPDDRSAETRFPTAHVIFPLQVDDGWPPVSAERVWAHDLGDNNFQVDNVPWFVRDLAVGDIVEAIADGPDTHPTFVRLLEFSEPSAAFRHRSRGRTAP